MSIYYRKQNYKDLLFKKNLHLKKRVKEVLMILPVKYSFDDFLQTFIDCYPTVWEDIVNYCDEKRSDFLRRKKKKLQIVPCCSPIEYLKRNCCWKRNSGEVFSDEEQKNRYEKLVEKGRAKKEQRDTKTRKNLERVQEVTPSYVKDLITAYFKTRRKDTLNVNARYLILLEAAQFHGKEIIQFLHKVAACEKNDELREFAYQSLVQLGVSPWKSRKRKGCRKTSQLKRVDIQSNPTEFLQILYANQQLLYQSYDIFLSHSSLDVNELLELKQMLNRQDLVVYIDWINDPVMLNRPNQNEDTWNVLELRMQQSKTLLYVMTDNSIRSQYTEREVNYFKSLSKRIVVYQPYEISLSKPSYIEGCEMLDLGQLMKYS